MYKDVQKKLLEKEMTRREFLQFAGGSLLVLFGLGNLMALLMHMKKTVEPTVAQNTDTRHGFGSRKFGA